MANGRILESAREDDFVEYYLFPLIETKDEKEEEKILASILSKANKIVDKYTKDYLWHKDEFKLVQRTSGSSILTHLEGKNENLPPHLYGVSHYGDNIEDEWFMVYLLTKLTQEITGIVARVCDADGEFILIEAADYLPTWANPDTTENRVYIYDGIVHIIQPENIENPDISITSALSILRSNPSNTSASSDIQNSLKNKLKNYPENIAHNLYHCSVYLPTAVAAILKNKPNLIAPAVSAFCNRDPIDMKACRAMKYFPPENRAMSRVKFTKCLYAMLNHSKYVPDRRTGWNLPAVNSKDYKKHSLGVKIACGFEILVSQAKPSDNIEGDKGWNEYLNSLKEKSYFRGLLEGSREYKDLLNKAKEYYINHRDSMQYSPAIGREILELLRNLDSNDDDTLMNDLQPDDDDSWLNISPEELDKMLQERYGQRKIFNVNNNTDAGEFTEKLSKFLDRTSGIDGVEFAEETRPVRPPRTKNKSSKVSFQGVKENNKINFDPNSFECAVQNILNFVIPEDDSWDLESDSDMSEYENDNYVKETTYDKEKTKNEMEEYMAQMDRELAKTTIGESFEKKKENEFEDIESFDPVDIDVNALKNILESYKSQLGEAGPSSNMLGPMGMHLNPK